MASESVGLEQFSGAADVTRKQTKKNINCLEKHYYSLKQRLQAQVIVFKPGEHGFLLPSPHLYTVQVNERVVRQASVSNQVPVKEVTLELLHKDYLMGRDGLWHAHLDIHRMLLLGHHCHPKTGANEQIYGKSSCKNLIPASCQFPLSKPTSKRLIYRPFPQKKNHLRSEVARKLGLYESHKSIL